MHKPLSKTQIKELNSKEILKLPEDFSLIFLLQDIEDPINVGALFRIADGCSAELILTGSTPKPSEKGVNLTSRGMDRKVEWFYEKNFDDALNKLKSNGYEIIGLELTEDSRIFYNHTFKKKTCIVLGNESKGIYKKNIDKLDVSLHIPMLGKGPSLNVHTAAAVIGYECLRNFLN